jgi:type IV secretory pathway component VirB8
MPENHSNFLAHDESKLAPVHDDHNHSNTDHGVHKHSHNHKHGGFGHSHSHSFRDTNSRILFWCLLITFHLLRVLAVISLIRLL